MQSESFQIFVAMNEEKMQAAKQMSLQGRYTIMAAAARVNNSIDESMDQTPLQQQQSQNTTSIINSAHQ